MRAAGKWGLRALLFAFLAVPLAAVVTFFLTPLWSWIESRYGIESLGHSGPSDWCFYFVYGAFLLAGAGLAWSRSRRPSPGTTPEP